MTTIALRPKFEDGTETTFAKDHAEALGRAFPALDDLAHQLDVRGPSSFDAYADVELPEGFEGDEAAVAALVAEASPTYHDVAEAIAAISALVHALEQGQTGSLEEAEVAPTLAALSELRRVLEHVNGRDIGFHLDVE